jgi:hypothetical protein
MKQRRFSLVIAAVMLAALTLLSASSTARTHTTIAPAQSINDQIMAMMTTMNAGFEATGLDLRVDHADYLTSEDSGEIGQTVFFNDRAKQIGAHFVPGDPRRGGRTNITFTVDQTEGAVDGLTQAQTNAAIFRAMATWDSVNCSTIPINRVAAPAGDIGVVEFLSGLGGSPVIAADIVHAGWLPGGLLPPNVIAVTFTFVFVSGGVPTDIDNNGKADTAFAETLYNDAFVWRINGNIDVETVALHESGHALSQGHFGKAFLTNSNGKIHFAPRAVMNAAYTGVQQEITGTDNGGHCSIWGSWPNN